MVYLEVFQGFLQKNWQYTTSEVERSVGEVCDVTMACEDANSKLVVVVTVADEDRVGNNLLQISKLRLGQKAKLLFQLKAQDLVKILKLKFRQNLKLKLDQFFCADVL